MFTKKTDKDGEIFGVAGAANTSTPAPAEAAPAAVSAPAITSRATAPAAAASSGTAPSYLGNDLLLKGNLVSKGEVQIDGQVEGDIRCTSLVVGEKADIKGGICAHDVVVRGHVSGSIHGVRVTLESSSQFEGEVFHKTLAIEQGAFFEGQSRRSDDPIAEADKKTAAATAAVPGVPARTGSTIPTGIKPGMKK